MGGREFSILEPHFSFLEGISVSELFTFLIRAGGLFFFPLLFSKEKLKLWFLQGQSHKNVFPCLEKSYSHFPLMLV